MLEKMLKNTEKIFYVVSYRYKYVIFDNNNDVTILFNKHVQSDIWKKRNNSHC